MRERDRTPLVMLLVTLLRADREAEGPKGMLRVELPLFPETEVATVAALERYGWAGQTWAEGDPHWPAGDPDNLQNLQALMASAGLRSSFVFPPEAETGNVRAQPLEVTRARGSFLMPPLEVPVEPPSDGNLSALREIVLAYRTFYPEAPSA